MDENEQKALDDIAAYGCHVLHILEQGEWPPFAYSIGIQRTSAAPEVLVIGLSQPLAHFVVNEYNLRVRAGESFQPGVFYNGFLEGFAVTFVRVDRSHYREYLGWARWLYDGDDFDALQLVYPTTDGVWPWDAKAADDVKAQQPIVTANGARPTP